jgi:diguanylate cyclase (GGDEF)-like protein
MKKINTKISAHNSDEDYTEINLKLQKRIELLEAVINNFPGGLVLIDADLRLVLCNEQQRKLLDYPEELFANGMPSLEDIFRCNALRGEYGAGEIEDIVNSRIELVQKRLPHVFERTRPNGTVLEVRGMPLVNGGFVTTYLDVTEQRKAQQLISHMAHHDALTNLPNRVLMMDRLKMLAAGTKRGRAFALHYIDLDKFKPINDTYGHQIGDEVLKNAAKIMLKSVRETDTVARVGGDEFIVLQMDFDVQPNAKVLAQRIIENLSVPQLINGIPLTIGASIGIACAPWDGDTPEEILRKADMAMYRSKANRGQASFYSDMPEQESWQVNSPSPRNHAAT